MSDDASAPADDHGHGAGDDHGHAHGLPFNPWIIFFALLILTGLSWGADAFLGGRFSLLTVSVIVMAISTVKATLVIAFFMHYRYESKWKFVLTIPPMIVGVLIMLALVPDVGYRHTASTRPGSVKADANATRAPWTDPNTGEPITHAPGAGRPQGAAHQAGSEHGGGEAPKDTGHGDGKASGGH